MTLADQLPRLRDLFLFVLKVRMTERTTAPESNRMMVKPAASIDSSPNANRHNTEFAANAIKARAEKNSVFTNDLSAIFKAEFHKSALL